MSQQTTFTAPNISCGHCVKTIQREVSQLSGVKFVAADPATKKVTVQVEDDKALSRFKALMSEIGYPVQV